MDKIWRIGVTAVVAASLLGGSVGAAYGSTNSLRQVGKATAPQPALHQGLVRHISPMDEPYCC
jgi:hypothetical protein